MARRRIAWLGTPQSPPWLGLRSRTTCRAGDGAAAPIATADRPPELSPSTWPYPYYYEPERPVRRLTSALASCLMAAAFLLFATDGAATTLFLLFRPQPLEIAVAAVRLPSFAAANGTVAFTFEQVASLRNANCAPLAQFKSSLRVAYAGGEIGSIYIPTGLIDSGSTNHWSTTFAVPAFPTATPPPLDMAAQKPAAAAAVMEVDSLLVVKGKVMVLRVRRPPVPLQGVASFLCSAAAASRGRTSELAGADASAASCGDGHGRAAAAAVR